VKRTSAAGVSILARRPSRALSLLAVAPPLARASRTASWRVGSWLKQKRRPGSANDRQAAPSFVRASQACSAPAPSALPFASPDGDWS
jgi:hypothetical protein